ncbi:hypothetical protein AYL99_11811 [Fonsecaea erecta]|uniref:Uncharacterized protein n=1 Tax=Fonsecaea erecta TaxID=1367422 RepID=A0A178Z338_9EURO|nr:hypothetical protein AYL99_11811 [Fonsecaea erecta]OAP53931.1 hypothetical protein AYL99_11811 [Fonsecaea erecta]
MDITDTVALKTNHPDVNGVFVSVGEGDANDVMEPGYLSNLVTDSYVIGFSLMNKESNWSLDRAGHGESVGYKDVSIVGLIDGWVALDIVVTDALVLLPSENIISHTTTYVRIGLPMSAFSKMYAALNMCGRVGEIRDGICWLNMDTNGGVLKDIPRTKFIYTAKSGDDLIIRTACGVGGMTKVIGRGEASCLVSFRVRVKYATVNINPAVTTLIVTADKIVYTVRTSALTTRTAPHPEMCKRLIKACVICKGMTPVLVACKEYDPNRYPNTPVNVWLHNHAKSNRNNVRNSLKFTFCDTCKGMNTVTTQPECDNHYKDVVQYIIHVVRVSYLGVTEVRNKTGHGIIFLDGDISAPGSPIPSGSRGRSGSAPTLGQHPDDERHEPPGDEHEGQRDGAVERGEHDDDDHHDVRDHVHGHDQLQAHDGHDDSGDGDDGGGADGREHRQERGAGGGPDEDHLDHRRDVRGHELAEDEVHVAAEEHAAAVDEPRDDELVGEQDRAGERAQPRVGARGHGRARGVVRQRGGGRAPGHVGRHQQRPHSELKRIPTSGNLRGATSGRKTSTITTK